MMKMKTTMREWGDLPEELLSSIASNLYGKDIQSFSLVCRSWNAAVAESPYRRSPCLMLYNKRKGLWQFHQHSSIFYMRLPELEKAHICCSKYGWLLMCRGDRDLFFFDPFNRRKIEIVDDESEKRSSLTSITFFNPPTSPKCFVVGFESYDENSVAIEILQRGIDGYRWERHDYSSEDLLFLETVSAPVLRRGVLYFVDMKANVATLDVSRSSWTVHTKCLPFRQLRNKIKHHFLFEIKGDEALYAVFLIHDVEMVNVFRLSEPNMEWELLTDLGDKMVYLTHASSFGDTAHFPTMANNIYFPRFLDHHILSYSLNTRKYHSLDYSHSHTYSYGLRAFHLGVAWILPAPADHFHHLSPNWILLQESQSESEEEESESEPEESESEPEQEQQEYFMHAFSDDFFSHIH